jgi:hypothetical protein
MFFCVRAARAIRQGKMADEAQRASEIYGAGRDGSRSWASPPNLRIDEISE